MIPGHLKCKKWSQGTEFLFKKQLKIILNLIILNVIILKLHAPFVSGCAVVFHIEIDDKAT